jgi:hypothetical protein
MPKSITRFNECDVYICGNDVEWYGFDKNSSLGEMIDKAIENKCTVITKNGNGKWYLKGIGKEHADTMEKVEKNVGKYPRLTVWVLEY